MRITACQRIAQEFTKYEFILKSKSFGPTAMASNSPKLDKRPSLRAALLICLEKFSTDINNIEAETKKVRIQLTEYKNGPAGPPPATILHRIDTLKNNHNTLKRELNSWFAWFDQLAERGKLKDSILVPKKYHASKIKGQLQAYRRQWHALRLERKGMEAELEVKGEDDVDAIQLIG
ncbi:hypothetical protein L211DRAFT_853450 [Terfezia boudieri ATCC MYA-4762]|uniref:Uncharacterized protein n=1 Tax=Terfezia boudieri ATCC MYA-4762 TaxID=1051890 RepID=A0A3N4L8F0_9PEZI|nr:hypothetical protein L211DRAFT_853450 [Terfezia boudieri ATCC MYA-4762]